MSSIIEILAYSASGSLVALFVKELIEIGRAERAHTLELKKRYFDFKLDATLKAAKEAKLSTSMLRVQFRLLHDSLVSKQRLNLTIWTAYCEGNKRILEQVSSESKGVSALLSFFYKEPVMEQVRAISDIMGSVMQNGSKATNIMEDLAQLSALLEGPPEIDREAVSATIANAENQLLETLGIALRDITTADEAVDALIKEVSKTYKPVAFQ